MNFLDLTNKDHLFLLLFTTSSNLWTMSDPETTLISFCYGKAAYSVRPPTKAALYPHFWYLKVFFHEKGPYLVEINLALLSCGIQILIIQSPKLRFSFVFVLKLGHKSSP